MANISINNLNQNAPWWWKRLETGITYLCTGMIPLIGMSASIPQDLAKDLSLVWLPGVIIGSKTIGILLGESMEQTIIKNKEGA